MPAATRKSAQRPPAEQPGDISFGPALVEPDRKPPSLRQAIAEARREVALTLPLVIRTLARESIEGSVNHLKLYLELSGVLKGGLAAPPKQLREPTLEEVLVKMWDQDKAIEAADAERARERAEEVLSGI